MTARVDLYLGAISGTSMDGLDLAVIEALTPPRIVAGTTVPLPASLTERLRDAALGVDDGIERLGVLDTALGAAIAEAVLAFIEAQGLKTSGIAAIGSHGQTVRHRPGGDTPFTWQIGDPNVIAERTGITTVADFRRRDVAAGGQGAPLVPPFHEALFRTPDEDRVVLNVGGIANITVLERGASVTGFDTGPGNALLDAWILACRGAPFDDGGAFASSGTLENELLERLLEDPYLEREPPKSTGKEVYHLRYVEQALGASSPAAANVQATLAELTAVSVTRAIQRWGVESGSVVVCGGGRHNRDLMARLERGLARHTVVASEHLGQPGDWIEAAAFAWLAWRRLASLPGNAPPVTGARGERVLGAVYG